MVAYHRYAEDDHKEADGGRFLELIIEKSSNNAAEYAAQVKEHRYVRRHSRTERACATSIQSYRC